MIKKRKSAKKRYRVKKQKSILQKKLFWFVLVLFLLSDALVYGLVFWQKIQVKGIEILGNQNIETTALRKTIEENLEQKLAFVTSKSILLVDLKKIENELVTRFPQIAKVRLERKLPNLLSLKIDERRGVAIWCAAVEGEKEEIKKCFKIDREGVIFEPVSSVPAEGLIIFSQREEEIFIGKQVLDSRIIQSIQEIERKLKEKLEIKEFWLKPEKLVGKAAEGFEIYFDLRGDLTAQIQNLKLLLQKEIGPEIRGKLKYIDLRFGNRVFYR